MHQMLLQAFVAAVRAIPDAENPQEASAALRRQVIQKIEQAKTQAEAQEAYEFHKAYYENKPYTEDEY